MVRKPPTQSDVAKLANVSRSTVSLVINGRSAGRIPEATRDRVLKAVRQLGYGPNVAARMLVQQKNRLIGVFTYEPFFPYERDHFFYPFILGIERQASRDDYNLLLFTRTQGGRSRGIYRDEGNMLGMVDGSIVMGTRPELEEIRRLVHEERAFVFIGRRDVPGCDFNWVASDYRAASFDAVTHLARLGHRRIAYIGTGARDRHQVERVRGCEDGVRMLPNVSLRVWTDDILAEPAAMLSSVDADGITAVICYSHGVMARVWSILMRYSRRVPDHVSLLSLTEEPVDFTWPLEPTRIDLNRTRVGEEAVKLLVRQLNGAVQSPQHVLVPCQFIQGKTTGRVHDG